MDIGHGNEQCICCLLRVREKTKRTRSQEKEHKLAYKTFKSFKRAVAEQLVQDARTTRKIRIEPKPAESPASLKTAPEPQEIPGGSESSKKKESQRCGSLFRRE